MKQAVQVLIVSDSSQETHLLEQELQRAGLEVETEQVDSPSGLWAALEGRHRDVVLCSLSGGHFQAAEAVAMVQERKLCIPFIIVSDPVGDEQAAAMVKAGAEDFVLKENL